MHTEPRAEDYLLAPEKQCDRYEYKMFQYTHSIEYKSVFEKNKSLIKYLEEKSGEKLNTLKSIMSLYDQLGAEQSVGKRFVVVFSMFFICLELQRVQYTISFFVLFFACSLPEWAEKIMTSSNSDFENLMKFGSSMYTRTADLRRLRSGFLLKEILDRSTNKTQSILSPNRSVWMYFAHVSTLNDMLNSLGLQQV